MQNRKLHFVKRGSGGCIAVLTMLAMFTTPIFAGDWADGFNGNINNWSVRTGSAMSYSTTYSKGGVTGAGSMAYNGGYSGAMWRSTGGRPSYTGIIKAQFYDSQMIRPTLCGNWHRMMIGACGTAYATGLAAVGMYSASDRNSYFIRNNSVIRILGSAGSRRHAAWQAGFTMNSSSNQMARCTLRQKIALLQGLTILIEQRQL